ncbi:hypothetical protein GQ44DRAFT_701587 [Phaeosphaeriaceae sp. PMI808]|nr:hypothetical protein GQ44DRAFT_701587 [Phaeosphaeriaceae sp. PMI808]
MLRPFVKRRKPGSVMFESILALTMNKVGGTLDPTTFGLSFCFDPDGYSRLYCLTVRSRMVKWVRQYFIRYKQLSSLFCSEKGFCGLTPGDRGSFCPVGLQSQDLKDWISRKIALSFHTLSPALKSFKSPRISVSRVRSSLVRSSRPVTK